MRSKVKITENVSVIDSMPSTSSNCIKLPVEFYCSDFMQFYVYLNWFYMSNKSENI